MVTSKADKHHEQFALELWAKINGYKRIAPTAIYGVCHEWKDAKGVTYPMPTIDHPFLHSIIKGLDEDQYDRYEAALSVLVDDPDGLRKAFHTATVEQILEAIYRSMHG